MTEALINLFKKSIFPILWWQGCNSKPLEIKGFLCFFLHAFGNLSHEFLQTWVLRFIKKIQNLDSSLKMTWFHLLTDQFWLSLASNEHFCFYLNVSHSFENGSFLLYPSWRSVVDQETAHTNLIPPFTTFGKLIGIKDPIQLTFHL